MRSNLGSRPPTAATGFSDSPYHSSSDRSFAYSVISSKFQSTGETQVLLLPKVNARRSIKFDKEMTGPKIMAVRETAQWLISNNNRMTDDLSKECRRLDDSYLKWYRKHFNDKKDVLERVSNLLNIAKQESSVRTLSKSPERTGKSTRSTTRHQLYRDRHAGFFSTELPDVEHVNLYRDTTVDEDKPVDTVEDKNVAESVVQNPLHENEHRREKAENGRKALKASGNSCQTEENNVSRQKEVRIVSPE